MAKRLQVGDQARFMGYKDRPEDFERVYANGSNLQVVEDLGSGNGYKTVNKHNVESIVYENEVKLKQSKQQVEKVTETKQKRKIREAMAKDVANQEKAKSREQKQYEKEEAQKAKLFDQYSAHNINFSAPVQDLINEHEANLTSAVRQLVTQAELNYFRMGGVLSYIYLNNLYIGIPYTNEASEEVKVQRFSEYCTAIAGISYEKALQHIRIYVTAMNLGIPEEEVIKTNFSNLREILEILNDENWREVLEFCSKNTVADVKKKYKTHKTVSEVEDVESGSRDMVKKAKYTFSVLADNITTIDEALEIAKDQLNLGPNDNDQAFAHIIASWLETHVDSGKTSLTLDQYLELGQLQYGVTLQAVETETTESGQVHATV